MIGRSIDQPIYRQRPDGRTRWMGRRMALPLPINRIAAFSPSPSSSLFGLPKNHITIRRPARPRSDRLVPALTEGLALAVHDPRLSGCVPSWDRAYRIFRELEIVLCNCCYCRANRKFLFHGSGCLAAWFSLSVHGMPAPPPPSCPRSTLLTRPGEGESEQIPNSGRTTDGTEG